MATLEDDPRLAAEDGNEKIPPEAGSGQAESHEVLEAGWVENMERRGFSPNTIRLYRRSVAEAYHDLGPLPHLEMEDLEPWVLGKGGRAGTIANRISALVCFYRWLTRTKRIKANPATEIERPKQPKRNPKPIEDLENALQRLWEADERANERGSIPRRVGETPDMVSFLCYTGLRIHEAVKCDWPVPCPDEAFLIGKGNKEELMQIHAKAREAWDRLGGKWPIGARATQRRFERAGITPHMCRHWHAPRP